MCDYVTVFEAEQFAKDDLSQEAVEVEVKEEIETAVRYKLLLVLDQKIDTFVKSS